MAARPKANPTVIGAFVLGALALVAAAVITLGGAAIFTPKQRAVVFFEGSVNGLAVGAPVDFRGVNVGSVDKIALQFDSKTYAARIPVYLTLLPGKIHMIGSKGTLKDVPFESFIHNGLRAKLNLQSFVTGQLTVALDFLPDTPALEVGSPDPDIPEIPAAKSDFDVIKEQLTRLPIREVADDVHRVVEAVRSISEGTNTTLINVNKEMQITAAEARVTLATATKTLNRLQTSLDSIDQTTAAATETIVRVGPQFSATLAKADKAFDHSDATLARIDKTFNNLGELTAPGAPLRLNLEQTLHDLSETAESLRGFADTVDRSPNALVFGKDKK